MWTAHTLSTPVLLPLPFIYLFFWHSHFLSTARLDLWLPLTLVVAASSHQHSNNLIFITQLLALSCKSILENETSPFQHFGLRICPPIRCHKSSSCTERVSETSVAWRINGCFGITVGHVAAPLSAFRSSFSDSCRCDSSLSKIPQTGFWDTIPQKGKTDFEGR